jgi:geranylgeranyl reductase
VAFALNHPRPAYLFTISAKLKHAPLPDGTGGNGACEFWFGTEHASHFYSWIFPSQEYSSIGTGSNDPKELSSLLDRFTRRRFNTSFKDLAAHTVSGKARAFKMPEWNGKLFNIENILFTGDAAGMVMPVTYEGIYYAMKSGEFAARAITEGKPDVYKKLWKNRFYKRFLLMSRIRSHLFRSDGDIEKWVTLHKNPEVQEIAMRLWLQKKPGSSTLVPYMNIFKSIFKSIGS